MLAPILRRHVLEPAWSRYSGGHLYSAWRELELSQQLSADAMRARQLDQLCRLLGWAYEHNDFYRQRFERAGFNPGQIQSIEDIRRIPLLTKQEVRREGTRLLSRGFDPVCLVKAKTGGSTGKPIEVYFTEEVSQSRNASGRRNKRWAGWEVGEPVGAVWGNPIYPETFRQRLREWVLAPSIYLDTMSVTPESVREFARQWERVRPTMLFGHAHSLFVVATMVRELGITSIRPRAILPTSMMLPPHERATIEAVFGAKSTDIYGCEEVGLIAGECELHQGLHINVDQLVVEVLDEGGQPVAPGETGSVVVTDLLNTAMPFIRYTMEDVAEVATEPCPCGRPMPTLRRIIGRTADFLRRRDGSRVAGISLIENTLTRIPGFDQMQIVQEELTRIVVRIVPGPDCTPAARSELVAYFETTFPGAEIALEEVSSIAAEPNGKYRFSICRLPS
jgi:phenylacetate-CoA ligase